ncbi:MAG: hypothetical protein J6M31_06370, partial [Bacteroidales bacterium]|nr:hypothetical protein [Bacteroidales bacterium]
HTQQGGGNAKRSATGSLPEPSPRQVDKESAGRLTLLSLCAAYGIAETLTNLLWFDTPKYHRNYLKISVCVADSLSPLRNSYAPQKALKISAFFFFVTVFVTRKSARAVVKSKRIAYLCIPI